VFFSLGMFEKLPIPNLTEAEKKLIVTEVLTIKSLLDSRIPPLTNRFSEIKDMEVYARAIQAVRSGFFSHITGSTEGYL
jgi:hypothetical protein